MDNPKVSIIVPVHNVEKYLRYCVDSLLNQTLTDIEIILVDDESPDNCPVICDEYAKQDHRVKVIHKKNGGQGFARNSGLEIATGEYIAFVDSDDYVETMMYQKLYNLVTETKADTIYCAFQRINDNGDAWMETSVLKEKRLHSKEEIRGLILDMIANPPEARNDQNIQCSVWSALYRHDIIRKYILRFMSEREYYGGEDLIFNIDYLLYASLVIITPDVFYNYRFRAESDTRVEIPDRIDKDILFYQYQVLEKLKKNNFGKDGYLRATRLLIGNSRANIRRYIQSSFSLREKKQWLKRIVNLPVWREIASSYPYKQFPLKYALHFYLLHKGYCRFLYYYSTMSKNRKPQ